MNTIRILINGYAGRMGKIAIEIVNSVSDLEYIAGTDRHDDLKAAILKHQPDIVIDATTAEAGFANAQTIIENGARPVVITSGFTAEKVTQLQAICMQKKRGGIIAPNLSMGAILMMRFAKIAAEYFPQAEIVERHHEKKADAPSGTALRTAELIAHSRPEKSPPCAELLPGALGAVHQGVHIHSLRLAGSNAHQQVIFGGTDETLMITHDTIGVKCYSAGILFACRAVMKLNHLVYGLDSDDLEK